MLGGRKVIFTLASSQGREGITRIVVVQSLSALWPRQTASQQTIFVLTRNPDYIAPLLSSLNYFAPLTFVLSAESINHRVGIVVVFFAL